jgi:hypothetical protein
MFTLIARRLTLAGVTAACAVGIAAAPASATVTVSVGDAQLIGKVAATVPVTMTCGPFAPGTFNAGGTVSLAQARGQQIARGSGFFSTGGTNATPVSITCDQTPQQITVALNADPNGPPFKNGTAVATVTASASTNTFPFTFESATTGPVEIRLH